MKKKTRRFGEFVAAVALLVALPGLLCAQQSVQQRNDAVQVNQGAKVPPGKSVEIEGIILQHDGSSLQIQDKKGGDHVVTLSGTTQIKEKKSNPFRGAKVYDVAQLKRGLYVEVEGRDDGSGRIQAERIRFKDDYVKVADSMETMVAPVEVRVQSAETRLTESEKNAQRLSGQIQEVSAVSNAARSAAKTAQDTADQANVSVKDTADMAKNGIRVTNERISTLDDYDVKGAATVTFAVGSAVLTKEGKAELDKIAEEAGNQKGYVIEVAGFTSSEGGAAINQRLSQRRADVVVQYLATDHSVPLRRIVMPMGYGEKNPVADNKTRDGRKQNRRVEVKVLVSKGLVQSPVANTGGQF